MKQYLYVILTTVAIVFCSCADEADTNNLVLSNGYMTVNETNIVLNGAGESKTVSMKANCHWHVSVVDDWVSVNPSNGNNSGSITISAQANPSVTSDRSTTITVSTDDDLTRTIHVRQEKNVESLKFSVDSLGFVASGETKTVVVESNAQWEILGTEEWFTLSKTKGDGNQEISITATPNTKEEARRVVLTVKGVTTSSRLLITQDGNPTSITLNTTSLTFDAAGSTKVIELSGNAEWTASSSEEWLTLDQLQGTGTYPLKVTCTDNASMASRTAVVTIRTRHNEYICTITQAAGQLPKVSGIQALSIERYAVSVTAMFTSDYPVTEYGFCYSETNQNPTVEDKKIKVTSQEGGVFKAEINGLESHATYYIRAYAKNKVGTSYSSELMITTEGGIPNQDDNIKPNI